MQGAASAVPNLRARRRIDTGSEVSLLVIAPAILGLALLVGAVVLGVSAVWALLVTPSAIEATIVAWDEGVETSEAPAVAWLREGALSPATFAMIGGLLAGALASWLGRRATARDARRTPVTPPGPLS